MTTHTVGRCRRLVSRGRPLSLLSSAGGGKKSLVEACTSFRAIPLDSWGTILSMYCLSRGAAFRDVELNTRIINCVITSNAFFGRHGL